MKGKSSITILSAIVAASMLSSCINDFAQERWDEGNIPGANSSTSGDIADFGELSSFTVEFNTSPLTETETIPSDETDTYYNEYIENNFSQKNVTEITFNGTSDATVSGLVKGDTINVSKGHVEVHSHAKGLTLRVSGTTTDGSLKIYSEKKFSLELSDAQITNPSGSAINIQNGNCFVVLKGSNILADGSSATYTHPDDEDEKAVFFSEDDLRFSGTGMLSVNADNQLGKECISSDDAIFVRPNTNLLLTSGKSAGSGMKANDAIVVKGGVLNIETAAKASKGLSSDSYMLIDGGRTTIITTGGVDVTNASDPSGCAAIRCDSILDIKSGELRLKSTGQGGKGISSDIAVNIAGGQLYIITEGSQYGTSASSTNPWGGWGSSQSSSETVSPKGIRCDQDITISGGDIMIRTYGTNGEGIESKTTLTFSGGNTAVLAYDDGFNAKTINISGGKALAVSTGNCDGIDSNGTINATGGVLIGVASNLNSEDGIDTESTLTVTNATVIGLSLGGMGFGRVNGNYISTTVSGNRGDYVSLCDGDTPLVTFWLPRSYNNGKLIISTPTMKAGSYTLKTAVTTQGGSLWMNLLENPTSIAGGTSASVTAR